jgi:glucosamine--fructose-6-phosphate aminotransferase (isomerizing)
MCGIVGIITAEPTNTYSLILNSLRQLQNRGYDSSGIGLLRKDNIEIQKFSSTIDETSIDKLYSAQALIDKQPNYIGIGHNRWATHGKKTDINAHPHISQNNEFSIVHNGIIENYQQLKTQMKSVGYTFYSQTDTEVIVSLLEHHYNNDNDVFNAISSTINELEGTYGLIIIHRSKPNSIYAVRNGSPLLVGMSEDVVYITSEQSGFCGIIDNYISINEDDIIEIQRDDCRLSINTKQIYQKATVQNIYKETTPDPYPHWTIKEIYEQEKTILQSLNNNGRIKNQCEVKLGGLEQFTGKLLNIENIILLGCGTSFHSALFGADYIKTLCKFNSIQVIDGAELTEKDIPYKGNTMFIFISQSGETRDLYRCIQIAKDNNIITMGVINVVDSMIAREVNCGVYCNSGREIGVASTKAFTSQVICLSLIAIWFSQHQGINLEKRYQIINDLQNLPYHFKNTLQRTNTTLQPLVNYFHSKDHVFVLGKMNDQYIAMEGSLKIKEMAYIHAEAYSSGSLKHGPFALLDEEFPVILIDTIPEYYIKNHSCAEEIVSRGSRILRITSSKIKMDIDGVDEINVDTNSSFSSLLAIIPIQLLSYYIAIKKNINPDTPRNLAKVVTVE